jgi:alpha-methylacyl-CoA racemase
MSEPSPARGPLAGLRIIEMAGKGPAPFAGMMLADHGAEVICIERPAARADDAAADEVVIAPDKDVLNRSRVSIPIDLKHTEGVEVLRDLARGADGLIEGFRPGVMERMGVGPNVLCRDNPRLVYGRMTGWGQEGPLAQRPGHDLNYIALAGNLHGYGRAGAKPTPPANAVGDFGGGGMLLAFGMLAAILHARTTGEGQVIDCAMVDGAALLSSMTWALRASGLWRDERGVNLLDTGAPFYEVYETADGKFVSVAAIEPRFYAALLQELGLARDSAFSPQMDQRQWPARKERFAAIFRTGTREAWCARFAGTEACVAPVLEMTEAAANSHNASRRTFITVDGVQQPAPAPRYSLTALAAPTGPGRRAVTADRILASVGYDAARIVELRARHVLGN